MKYLRAETFGSKDIVIRKSELVAKTQFLSALMFRYSIFGKFGQRLYFVLFDVRGGVSCFSFWVLRAGIQILFIAHIFFQIPNNRNTTKTFGKKS